MWSSSIHADLRFMLMGLWLTGVARTSRLCFKGFTNGYVSLSRVGQQSNTRHIYLPFPIFRAKRGKAGWFIFSWECRPRKRNSRQCIRSLHGNSATRRVQSLVKLFYDLHFCTSVMSVFQHTRLQVSLIIVYWMLTGWKV